MSDKSKGGPATLDLMGDAPAPAKPARSKTPAAAPKDAPVSSNDALFGASDVDMDARHPADVPVAGLPAPSSLVSAALAADDEEDDPFADTVMAQALADEPAPLLSPLRAAREQMQDTLAAVQEAPPAPNNGGAGQISPALLTSMEKPAPLPEHVPEAGAVEHVEEEALTRHLQSLMPPSPASGRGLEDNISASPSARLREPSRSASAGGPGGEGHSPRGLTFPRRYTTAGEDVWATTEYELRTASIVGSDGTVVFEQQGVEIPKSWSQLATNVVVSKYFRGHVGTLEREYSVKQLIGRVADRILEWGQQGRYFATPEDAAAFHDELRYILLHQMAAFNSPVWFNLGWPGRRQAVSACLPYGVRVNTDRGLLPIGEIVRLFGAEPDAQLSTYAPDGTPSRIVAAVCNGRRRVLNFHLSDGSTLRCTSNHRVFVRDSKGGVTEKEAGQLIVGTDKLVFSRDVLLPQTSDTKLGLLTPDADVAWLCGLMVGDGYCGRSETLTSHTWDLKINTTAERARAESVLTRYGVPFTAHEKSWGVCLRGHGTAGSSFWKALGLWDKVGQKAVPEWVFRADAALVGAFLGGLFDADGHVSENVGRRLPVFSNTSLPLVRDAQILLRSLGIFSSLSVYQDTRDDYTRKPSYSLGVHDNVSVDAFEARVGFTHENKTARLSERRTEAGVSFRSADALLVGKTLGGPEYVYDIQTESATFWAEGVLLHNCYINEVDDTMDSILDLYKTEGLLFKDGSGSGVNLSPLRGSNERLEAGGKSSGPISFMKGLDASAGSIKSGGSTRRAACMRVLDVDHPDVIDFIDCKKDAEQKAHALIDAGYSGAFNVPGGAYDTVPFQNANHSVRVTDEFMQAVETDGAWETKSRISGKASATFRARDVMRGIAEGTWVCGDPGMQYDTTINDWHTCSNTDRIYASNPCCITGDTLVAVADGRNAVAIRDLVGTEVPVYAHDHATGRTTVSRMWNIGVKRENVPIVRVTLDDGSTLRLTDDHLVMLRDGSYRKAGDLKPATSLMPFHSRVQEYNRTTRRSFWTGRSWAPQYRAVWEAAHGPQPDGYHIHHADFNALNDTLKNLVLMLAADHHALHGDKMRGDANPARRFMSDTWRQHISDAQRGEKNGHYGHVHSEETRQVMREKSALRWVDTGERARSGESIRAALARAKAESRAVGRPARPSHDRCCPVCRADFRTRRAEQIFCSNDCRCSPMGRQMSGEKIWAQNRGRALSAEHRAKLSESAHAASDPEAKRRAAQTSHRNTALKAARLLMDNGVAPTLDGWDALRDNARAFGAERVPTAATVRQHFGTDEALREQAALYNHKVVSVEPCGSEDVYDGTVDTHHNFAVLTSSEGSCAEGAPNYSGIFIHNSEYMFLNSTACNLSSLNLMKFRAADGAFDVDSFQYAVRVMLTAQEIVVGFADYPTAKIEERSHVYRTLGLGYANLGALLMASGLPYDSDAGRSYAGAVTALMTGTAYHQSAQIARDCGGPFAGYADNKTPMLRVMGKHRAAVDTIDGSLIPQTLLSAARSCWDDALAEGEKSGYRNAQATVLAPTGTIGFLMDCDTTGIEPDIAIVKYKTLVGGGMMKIVNQTVPEALSRLGYTDAQVASIVKFIDDNDTIEGAPDLKSEHLPIFDCAFRPMNGTRSIHYRGHIKMMAAAQPFLSGAISKTVNVPQDATPDDIAETYMEAWKLGIKAVAIYRDGSKRTQPLNTSRDVPAKEGKADAAAELVPAKAVRRRLPDERDGVTHKFSIGGHEGYLTVGLYPDTRQPGEIFIRMSKEGSSISGLMDSFATAISLALQYGVPLQTLVDKFIHSRFEPSGFTGNKEIPIAKSVMDYIFRYLALKFIAREDRHNVGLTSDAEPPDSHDAKSGTLSNSNGTNGYKNGTNGNGTNGAHAAVLDATASLTEHERSISRMQSDAPPCPECGAITIRSGACYKCQSCGTSLGCS